MALPVLNIVTTPDDLEVIRNLIRNYVVWLYYTFPDETDDLTSYYSPDRLQQALDELPTAFIPPNGIALLARLDGNPVGCVMAHPFGPGVAEMKRLFVVPSARGKGIGRMLIETLIARMAELNLPTIRLDTAVFLTEAILLYRRMGFVDIEPYRDVPPGAVRTAIFMEWRG